MMTCQDLIGAMTEPMIRFIEEHPPSQAVVRCMSTVTAWCWSNLFLDMQLSPDAVETGLDLFCNLLRAATKEMLWRHDSSACSCGAGAADDGELF